MRTATRLRSSSKTVKRYVGDQAARLEKLPGPLYLIMRTIVIGLGNPILCDDGVGWRVAQEVQKRLPENDLNEIEVDCFALGGISLMERLEGYDRAVIIDAIQTRNGVPGTLYQLSLNDLPTFNTTAIHDASLKTALDMGRSLGARLPRQIAIFAIEAVRLWEFGEELTPQVEASVEPAIQQVIQALLQADSSESIFQPLPA